VALSLTREGALIIQMNLPRIITHAEAPVTERVIHPRIRTRRIVFLKMRTALKAESR
jgi:hypothetical protein